MPQNPAATAFLATRRSHPAKMYSGPTPDRAALEPILAAALRVPDHGKLEPWRLIVLRKPALTRLADLAEEHALSVGAPADQVAKARGQFDWGQLVVVVLSSPKPSEKVPVSEQILSAGALCLGLVNAAEAAGWGANWLSGWPSHDPAFIARAYGATEGETVAGMIHIGTAGAEGADRPRPDPARIVTWVET